MNFVVRHLQCLLLIQRKRPRFTDIKNNHRNYSFRCTDLKALESRPVDKMVSDLNNNKSFYNSFHNERQLCFYVVYGYLDFYHVNIFIVF